MVSASARVLTSVKTSKALVTGVCCAALAIAIAMLAFAHTLDPYKDEEQFNASYMALSAGESESYAQLREQALTSKYLVQDYGGTLLLLAAVCLFFSSRGWRALQTPSSRLGLLILACACPLLTTGASFFDMFQSYSRGEYPHWADSLGLGVVAELVFLPVMFVWVVLHLFWLRRPCHARPLSHAFILAENRWPLAMAGISAALLLGSMAYGFYWFMVSEGAWLYFYLSLAALRSNPVHQSLDAAPD